MVRMAFFFICCAPESVLEISTCVCFVERKTWLFGMCVTIKNEF